MLAPMHSELERAGELLNAAQRVVVLTGAGISTDSGIPDFRGPDGLWTKDPAAEMLSNYENYMADTNLRAAARQSRLSSPTWTAEPNAGHRALLSLERRGVLELLITQNIDGLHHAAGSNPELIVEIHGNVRESVCQRCGDRRPMDETLDRVRAGEPDPSCLHRSGGNVCGGVLKSATISFGQSLVAEDLQRADWAARDCDLLLCVGSTLAVYPIASVVPIAVNAGSPVIIINGEPTAMDSVATVVLHSDISATLQTLLGDGQQS